MITSQYKSTTKRATDGKKTSSEQSKKNTVQTNSNWNECNRKDKTDVSLMQNSTFYKHRHSWRHFTSLCYISSFGQNCGANVPPVQLQSEELRLTHWRFHLREPFFLHHPQPAEVGSWPDLQSTCWSNCSVGIGDNIWEGLIFHQKDWDCLQSATLGCFTLPNCACKIFTACSHSVATNIKPVWVTMLQAIVWHQPVWFITCLNIKSIIFLKTL